MRRNIRALTVSVAAFVGLGLSTGAALATPGGPGVEGTIISQATFGGKDYTLREITIPPGQSTGWHFHDGTLYGLVKKGTLSHFDATCKSDGVYKAGSSLVEPSGKSNVHIGRNLGKTNVVLDVLYVLPHGAPFAEDAPNPGCNFQ
ncbi:cupin domain-containing protein [Streptomyces sp. NPDC051362]|uniref:cupin domain-containing protein n=1 Tax=Streptomyces sp. NPDC051362 TaxID=3365651 RepID=UPI0037AB594C